MADCDDRQLTEEQRQAGYQNQRTGVARALRPFSGNPTLPNLLDYINRELVPAVRSTRDRLNDVYLPVVDNAPSANPLQYYFSTNTANADPTTGFVRLDATPQNTATTVRVSETNARLGDARPWLEVMSGGSTTPLGVVTLSDAVNPARFIRFDLNSMTDQGTYWDLGVTPIESSTDDPFVDGGGIVMGFIPGVASTGTTVPPGSLTPITAQSVLGNPTSSTAAPVAIALNDLSVLGRAGVLGTNVAGINVPGTGTFPGESVFLRVASTRLAIQWRNWTLVDMPEISDGRFVGNVSGATARPIYTSFGLLSSNSVIFENTGKTFIREALTGDVQAAQNSNVTSIVLNAVTNAQLADMPAGTVKGRQIDAGTGDPVDLIGSEVAEIIRFSNVSTDAVGGTLNNYVLSSLVDVLNFTATTVISGITNGSSGRRLVISNGAAAGSGVTVDLLQFSALSSSINRFLLPKATALRLYPGDSIEFLYGTVGTTWCSLEATKSLYRTNSSGLGVSRSRVNFVDGTSVAWSNADVAASDEVTITSNVIADSISNTLLRNSGALSVIGRSANSTGDPADISAVAASGAVLRESGSVLGFGTVANAGLANMAAGTVKGRQIDAGTGVPVDLTGAEIAEIIRFSNRQVEATGGTLTDYALDPLADSLSITANATLSGMVQLSASTGRRVFVANGAAIGSGIVVDIIHFSVSTGGNRIVTPKGATLRLYPGDGVILVHGVTGNFWFTDGGTKAYYRTNSSGLGASRSRINFVDGTSVAWTNADVSANDEVTVTPNVIADSISNTLLRNSGALSVIGRSANSTGDPADISASAASDAVLRESGSVLGFGTVATGGIANNAVTNTKIRQSAALTVIGRAANSTGDVADIGAGSDGDVLRRSGTALGFGSIATAGIGDDQVSNAKLANMAAGTVKGRQIDAGTGDPVDLTGAEVGENLRLEFAETFTLAPGTYDLTLDSRTHWVEITPNATGNVIIRSITQTGGNAGGFIRLVKRGVSFLRHVVLTHADAGAPAGSEIINPRALDFTLYAPNSSVDLGYSTPVSAWALRDTPVRDTLSVMERAAGTSMATGQSEYFAKDDAPTNPYFRDDTNVDRKLATAPVPLTDFATIAQSRVLGRAEGAGTGVPTALTPTEVVAIIDGEAVTWTGAHSFTGSAHTVNVSGAVGITSSGSSVTLTANTSTVLAAGTTIDANSPTRLQSSVGFTSVLTSAATAANNLNIGTVNVVRFTGPVNPLTGMIAAATGQVVLLVNAHASSDVVILLEATGSSSAANCFAGLVTDRHIKPGEMALAWYDGTSTRWRLLCRDDVDL